MSNSKVVTGKVRLSYCNVFEARASQDGGEPKYSVSLLIPKSDTATVAMIEKAIESTIQDATAKTFQGKAKGLKLPLRDGDTEKDDPAYEGHWFLSASSKQKPIILDENRNAVLDPRVIYSGCYGRASINFFAFNTNGNRGIAAGLNAIMKLTDGEPLGGTYTEEIAAKDFDDDDLL